MKKAPHNHSVRRSLSSSRYRQLGILGRIFGSASLEIEIKTESFTFESVGQFKQFLDGKTALPSSKMQDMFNRSDKFLNEEIKQLTEVERNISDRLATAIRDPQSIDGYLDSATMVRFSQDYDWRQIMFELSKHNSDYSEYKLEAVTHYIQYLRSRIDVAKGIIADRSHAVQESSGNQQAMMETMETRELHVSSNEPPQHLMETSHIDLSNHKDEPLIAHDLQKIPRGQTVVIEISRMPKMPLKIASRKFVIDSSGADPILISKNGDQYPIKAGENLIGRSTQCSIVLNPEFVDISRQHLIIERYPDNTLHFTDLSSSGTKLPVELFED